MDYYIFEIYLEKMRTNEKLILRRGLVKAEDRVSAEAKVAAELDYIRSCTDVKENEVLQLGFEVLTLLS